MTVGWRSVPLTECIQRIETPVKIPRKQFEGSGRFPIVSQEKALINGYWSDDSAVIRAESPLVVFGDHTQVLKYIDFDFVVGADGVKLLQPKPFLNAKYFYYFLMANPIDALGYARHFRLLKELDIGFPESLSEQERIVAILDEAFAAIATATANAEKNLANARELFDAAFLDQFANQAHVWDRHTLADLIARGWITDHMDGNHGGDYPRKHEFIDSGIPYISANCIAGQTVDMSRAKHLSPERASKLRKGFAHSGDVLFAHNATVGPVAILETSHKVVILGTSLTHYRCDPHYVHAQYLAHFMRSPEFVRQYQIVMRQSTRNQVPITKQREFIHVIPPIDQQRTIASVLDDVSSRTDSLRSRCVAKIDLLTELKQSILHQALTGELTADACSGVHALSESGV